MKWLNYILNGWLTSGCGCHHGEQHVHPLRPRAHRQPLRESRTVAASPWALHRPLRHQEGGRSHPVASVRLARHLFRNSQVCSLTTIYSVCQPCLWKKQCTRPDRGSDEVLYSLLLICNRAVTNRHVVDIPPFFPSRLQLGWCFFNFSSCDFFLSKGYLLPCLKCNNDSHRGFYLDGVFSKRPLWLLIGLCFFPKFQGCY